MERFNVITQTQLVQEIGQTADMHNCMTYEQLDINTYTHTHRGTDRQAQTEEVSIFPL